jgi:hypothetical protein
MFPESSLNAAKCSLNAAKCSLNRFALIWFYRTRAITQKWKSWQKIGDQHPVLSSEGPKFPLRRMNFSNRATSKRSIVSFLENDRYDLP